MKINPIIGLGLALILLSTLAAGEEASLKIGVIFSKEDPVEVNTLFLGLQAAGIKMDHIQRFSDCEEATRQTQELINQQVDLLVSADTDRCTQPIRMVAKRNTVLHISLVLPTMAISYSFTPWLTVSKAEPPPQSNLILEAKEKTLSPSSSIMVEIKKQRESFLQQHKYYKVRVPSAYLRQRPERPGQIAEDSNVIVSKVATQDIVIEQPTTQDFCEEGCCREGKNKVWDWIYKKDWICVRPRSAPEKVGWIHRMLVEECKSPDCSNP